MANQHRNNTNARREKTSLQRRTMKRALLLSLLLDPTRAFPMQQQQRASPTRILQSRLCSKSSDEEILDMARDDGPASESDSLFADETSITPRRSQLLDEASFGQVVPLKRPTSTASMDSPMLTATDKDSSSAAVTLDPAQMQRRNMGVAALSVVLAVTNYLWQFFHPIQPIQLLQQMQQQSSPITIVGQNGKPTVVDFWAPW